MSPIPKPLFFFFFFLFNYVSLSSSLSLHLPLTSLPISSTTNSHRFTTSLLSRKNPSPSSPPYNFRSRFKYSMALIISLPIGTPPQAQQMVLDTGSQLSWIQCHRKKLPPKPKTSFDPSLSSSFSTLPCSHPLCKPRIPDFTLPTSCDSNRLCHYSYFYADGTFAEGNLVKEKITFSNTEITPPLILGCATESSDDRGILGMNRGRLSFVSQAKITKFSYCIPPKSNRPGFTPTGSFYLGDNPNSKGFKYVSLLTFPESQRMPNLDEQCRDEQDSDTCRCQRISLIGDLVFQFTRGVEILVPKERVLVNVGDGIHCVGIGRSSMLGAASNIIGNVHQQNLWVEFDVTNRRVGFARADCSRIL
ncbi:aspartic proteinase PCS1 [Arabidopsis lyrata subsp. lyrata]|uniref:aspartic proteinase PCS1 n=1 Tax=Arabidopsis lyrata subsp. lyrata TaxID=81972 RepID=UPI000A29DC5B|nr:aspartic proteinase PCS1 [Arabidopsis lyrata subsp. lyrata]|eukprot:XP_020865706.1 aspartic proteinase PCS1 [Arabidopsis lyrata subsp. lyrata]